MAISPLFDQYDPYGILQEQARSGLLPSSGGSYERRTARLSDLMPEEEKRGLLNKLASAASTGLSTAGWLLDTPGALVRGVLAGDPLSVFGDSERRVSGRDLLREYGLAGRSDNWQNFTGGVIAEAALDPLTYASLGLSMLGKGALGQAGKATKAAGLLRNEALDSVKYVDEIRKARGLTKYDDAIPTPRAREGRRLTTPEFLLGKITDATARAKAEASLLEQFKRFGVDPAEGMKQSVGVLDNFRIPGTNIGFEVQGGAVGDSLARTLDAAGNWTKTAPVVGNVTRTAAALFDPSVGGLSTLRGDLALTNDVQINKRLATARAAQRTEEIDRAYGLLQAAARDAKVPEFIPSGPLAGEKIPESLRTFDSQDLWTKLRDYATSHVRKGWSVYGIDPRTTGDGVSDWVLANIPEFRSVRDRFTDLGPDAIDAARQAGLATPVSTSRGEGGFFPRQIRRWLDRKNPKIPGASGYKYSSAGRDERAFSVQDNFGRGRDPAYDLAGGNRAFRYLTDGLTDGKNTLIDARQLQQDLINAATNTQRRDIVQNALDTLGKYDQEAFTFGGQTLPYQYVQDAAQGKLDKLVARHQQSMVSKLKGSKRYAQADDAAKNALLAKLQQSPRYTTPRGGQRILANADATVQGYYDKLTDLLMNTDEQFAGSGVGLFDNPSWNDALRYERGQAVNISNAEQLTEMLSRRAVQTPAGSVAGGQSIPLAEAAAQLGYDKDNFRKLWQAKAGADVSAFSIPKSYVDAMRTLVPQTQLEPAASGVLGAVDQFTNAFKVGALAYPGFHTRNAYSGAINSATQGAFNFFDFMASLRASQGDYSSVANRLAEAPGYRNLSPEERILKYKGDLAAQRVSGGGVVSDFAGGADPTGVAGLFPGAGPGILQTTKDAAYQKNRSWTDFLRDMTSLRGVGGPTRSARPTNTNPLLALNDSVGSAVEDMLRGGTFLNQVRKGVDPGVAGDITRLSQVDYSPRAFTSFERDFAKRLIPFYSFQKGILPSIADNLLYRPGGLQGQSIRAVSAASRPDGENILPERFRRSSAIPLPGGSGEGLQRYLTKIDLPWEGSLNMFTPGVGATPSGVISDTVAQTGSNVMGMLNPLLKAPIEFFTDRQFFSGRDLSDAYSVLEESGVPGGRQLEQLVTNFVPFGSRALGTYRQIVDDRLEPADKALKVLFNLFSGSSLTDVDPKKAATQAARNMLNKILESTPGVRTYENITVPEDALATMPEHQRRLYLLYRNLQSEAVAKARARKKAEADPLAMLR